ncbi:MAG: adenine-specific methyltransferase EcoRI family protein [Bacteroidaceae bacterium]
MSKNNSLTKAKSAKNDEFYTTYDAIQIELNHYEDKFENKVVFCNCDDPFESNFAKFFLRNFNYLKLKRLFCTSYAGSPITGKRLSLFDDYNEPVSSQHGYVLDITKVPMSNGRVVSDADITTLLHQKGKVTRLKGNGDYASDECLNYLTQSDIVVTNPPFSKFRSYLATLIEYDKKFLIIGNVNAITYKDVFPLIKENKIWLGVSHGGMSFKVPDNCPPRKMGYWVDDSGQKWRSMGNIEWFTNLDYSQRHEDLILYKRYNSKDFPDYDNYKAINVSKVADIPLDYSGNMGVPITFLDKYSPDQFEILGITDRQNTSGIRTKKYTVDDSKKYNDLNARGVVIKDGKYKAVYARILVRNKKVQE